MLKHLSITVLINFMMGCTLAAEHKIITHTAHSKFNIEMQEARLKSAPKLVLPLEEELQLLHELTQFDLGRFLLENKGINGYWTAYWLIHGPQKKLDHPLEDWLINKAPSFQASRERFHIFRQVIQKHLRSNMRLASVPCGLMDDLLGLDYTNLENIELDGFDLDHDSLHQAAENARKYNTGAFVSFYRKDAWHLGAMKKYDLITSNGLNFYEADDQKVEELYKEFYQSLSHDGILVTSFLTPLPGLDAPSPWKNFNPEDARKQKAIFIDIVNAKWNAHRSESLTRRQLESVGFKEISFIYDSQNIFPTVVAKK